MVSSSCASCTKHSEVTISIHSGQHFAVCLLHGTRQSDHFCPFWIALCRVPPANFVVCLLPGTRQSRPRDVCRLSAGAVICPALLVAFFFMCRTKHTAKFFTVCVIKGTRQSPLRRQPDCCAGFAVGGRRQMLCRVLEGLCLLAVNNPIPVVAVVHGLLLLRRLRHAMD